MNWSEVVFNFEKKFSSIEKKTGLFETEIACNLKWSKNSVPTKMFK